MLFKWFIFGGILGFVFSLVGGFSFQDSSGCAVLVGCLAVSLRKWILRTFWG